MIKFNLNLKENTSKLENGNPDFAQNLQHSCITNENNNAQNMYYGMNILERDKAMKNNGIEVDDFFHSNLNERHIEIKFETADQEENPKIINTNADNKFSEASERTPMKDHYKNSRIENLTSSEGKENIAKKEIKIGLNDYLGKEKKEEGRLEPKHRRILNTVE